MQTAAGSTQRLILHIQKKHPEQYQRCIVYLADCVQNNYDYVVSLLSEKRVNILLSKPKRRVFRISKAEYNHRKKNQKFHDAKPDNTSLTNLKNQKVILKLKEKLIMQIEDKWIGEPLGIDLTKNKGIIYSNCPKHQGMIGYKCNVQVDGTKTRYMPFCIVGWNKPQMVQLINYKCCSKTLKPGEKPSNRWNVMHKQFTLSASDFITIPVVKNDRTAFSPDFIRHALHIHYKYQRNDDKLFDALKTQWITNGAKNRIHSRSIIT